MLLRGPADRPQTAAIDPAEVLGLLAARGLTRILVEGGGCTVGRFVVEALGPAFDVLVAYCAVARNTARVNTMAV